jgi:hypothetical protein
VHGSAHPAADRWNVASSGYQSLKSLKYLTVPHVTCDMTQEKMILMRKS